MPSSLCRPRGPSKTGTIPGVAKLINIGPSFESWQQCSVQKDCASLPPTVTWSCQVTQRLVPQELYALPVKGVWEGS